MENKLNGATNHPDSKMLKFFVAALSVEDTYGRQHNYLILVAFVFKFKGTRFHRVHSLSLLIIN